MRDPGRVLLIDVRTEEEWRVSRVPGSVHIPLDELGMRAPGLDVGGAERVAVICHHGRRSLHGAVVLREAGIEAVSVAGGIEAWSREVDPSVPRYHRGPGGCRLIL
ncbi:MAG: hypothetical protein HRU70_15325 [Phycisphaeraceae bacterium]|nr:MAG: hypothetical protein HRU70_15325 [Phycisphaeraceae bacterium]